MADICTMWETQLLTDNAKDGGKQGSSYRPTVERKMAKMESVDQHCWLQLEEYKEEPKHGERSKHMKPG